MTGNFTVSDLCGHVVISYLEANLLQSKFGFLNKKKHTR